MVLLLTGIILFFGIHSLAIVANPLRLRLKAKLGELPWKAIYSLVAIIGFALMIKGYAVARMDPYILYQPPGWTRHITFLLMLPVFPLALAAYFPGNIQSKLKHPMLIATKTWAFSHLLANGTLADVLLFGCFLIWAVCDLISLKKRTQVAMFQMPEIQVQGKKFNDVIAVTGGLILYLVFLTWAHTFLIGMPLIRAIH
ncbi:hypothetical protein TDB9533_00244 [Thalassocella blandensis]|nr:hypothetical protein TDB9533_00244 [Thalassocella blandensis]